MIRTVLMLRYLFVIPGVALLLAGGIVALQFSYPTAPYIVGLAFHLLGLALCVIGVSIGLLPSWRSAALSRESVVLAARRARFRTGIQMARLLLAAIWLGSFLAAGGVAWKRMSELTALQHHGRPGEAWIISKEPAAELGRATSGLVYYSFRIDGTLVTGRFRASRADYPQLWTGRRFAITYLPSNPNIYLFGPVDARVAARHRTALTLLMLIPLAYLWLPMLALEAGLRRQLYLARRGATVTGIITGCRPISRGTTRKGYRIRYRFSLRDGSAYAGRARIGLTPGEPTLVGCPITVLVDLRRPWSHCPLAALSAVRYDQGLRSSVTGLPPASAETLV